MYVRIERFSLRDSGGIAKFVGSVVSLSGAMVFVFVKGPAVRMMSWANPTAEINSLRPNEKWMLGCLLMLAANFIYASWLVMQVINTPPSHFTRVS